MDIWFEEQNPTRIELEKMVETYDNVASNEKNYIIGLTDTFNLPCDHKPPLELDIFSYWVQDIVSLLSMCLGLESNKKVGASVLEMIFNIHCLK